MTVKELIELLKDFDENLEVEVKQDDGDYDKAEWAFVEDVSYTTATEFAKALKGEKVEWKSKKVVKIF